jgi:hypothetical protein
MPLAALAQPPDAPTVDFTVGAEAGNAIVVSGQIKKYAVNADQRMLITCWLSSDANGDTLATDPGTLVAGTNGTILVEITSNLVFLMVTEANGSFDVNIGHVSTSGFYLNVALPGGRVVTAPIAQFA